MPMRRKMFRRRVPRYRRVVKPTKMFSRKVMKVVKRTQEKKYHPFSGTSQITNAGYLLDFTVIAQGNTDTTRVGDMIYLKSLQFGVEFVRADSTNTFRMVLFQWKPPSSNATNPPLMSDILLDTTYPWISPYNHDQRKNYKILLDRRITLDSDDGTRSYRFSITRGFARQVQYIGGTSVGNNNLYGYIVSDSSAASHPGIFWSGKVNFTDS